MAYPHAWTNGSGQAINAAALEEIEAEIDTKAVDAAVVHLTGAETVAGVKTFSSSPIVPTPTTNLQAATKAYVDATVGSGAIRVEEEGSSVVAGATGINFVGPTVTVTDAGSNEALVTIAESTAITANTQTGSYTLVLGDAGKVVEMNVAGANTLTVPPNASVAFPIGTVLEVFQYGAGQTTITPGAAVTIVSSGAKLKTTGQYSSASLRKRATNEWVASGDLSA